MYKKLNKAEFEALLEKFNQNKDLVMKALEDDIRIMSYIAWGIGELYPEKSPREMFEYMKNPDLKELSKRIIIEETEMKDFSGKGYILDSLLTILNEDLLPSAFIDIENQLNFNRKEITSRSLVYLCTIQFKLGNYYKTGKFSDMKKAFSIWIFPIVLGISNKIEIHDFGDKYTIDNAELPEKVDAIIRGDINNLFGYFFFIGNPDKIDLNPKNVSEPILKQRIVLFLIDVLFNLQLSTKKKLEYLKLFHLTGAKVTKEMDLMENYREQAIAITEGMMQKPWSEIQKQDQELIQLRKDLNKIKIENEKYESFIDQLKEKGIIPQDFKIE